MAGSLNGSCVTAFIDPHTKSTDPDWAQVGMCSSQANQTEGATWAYDYCPTSYSWMATFGLVLYLAFFAPGKRHIVLQWFNAFVLILCTEGSKLKH